MCIYSVEFCSAYNNDGAEARQMLLNGIRALEGVAFLGWSSDPLSRCKLQLSGFRLPGSGCEGGELGRLGLGTCSALVSCSVTAGS